MIRTNGLLRPALAAALTIALVSCSDGVSSDPDSGSLHDGAPHSQADAGEGDLDGGPRDAAADASSDASDALVDDGAGLDTGPRNDASDTSDATADDAAVEGDAGDEACQSIPGGGPFTCGLGLAIAADGCSCEALWDQTLRIDNNVTGGGPFDLAVAANDYGDVIVAWIEGRTVNDGVVRVRMFQPDVGWGAIFSALLNREWVRGARSELARSLKNLGI